MDRPTGYHAKCNKSDKERQIPCDFSYMWNLKNKINKQTKQKQIHRCGEQTDVCQRGEGMDEKAEGIKKYKLAVTE